jgi:hypothetical protein
MPRVRPRAVACTSTRPPLPDSALLQDAGPEGIGLECKRIGVLASSIRRGLRAQLARVAHDIEQQPARRQRDPPEEPRNYGSAGRLREAQPRTLGGENGVMEPRSKGPARHEPIARDLEGTAPSSTTRRPFQKSPYDQLIDLFRLDQQGWPPVREGFPRPLGEPAAPPADGRPP